MKFEMKNLNKNTILLYEKSDDYLIWLGDICLYKENRKHESQCYQIDDRFDYQSIQNALCGKTNGTRKEKKQILLK